MKKYKKMIILVVLIIIGIVGIFTYMRYYGDKQEYLSYYEDYISLDGEIKSYAVKVGNLEINERQYEDWLYQGIISYYNGSDDEIFKYVFKERFPLPNEYENDRKGAFVVIYALLEVYPELKEDKVINETLLAIDNTIDDLRSTTSLYNDCIDDYNEIVEQINNSDYVRVWHKELYITKKYQKIIFTEPE